jgi:hypothetical protein
MCLNFGILYSRRRNLDVLFLINISQGEISSPLYYGHFWFLVVAMFIRETMHIFGLFISKNTVSLENIFSIREGVQINSMYLVFSLVSCLIV